MLRTEQPVCPAPVVLPGRQSGSIQKAPVKKMRTEVDPGRKVRKAQDANSETLELNPKATRRLAMTMNLVMGFAMLALFLVVGMFGLLLLIAHGVIA